MVLDTSLLLFSLLDFECVLCSAVNNLERKKERKRKRRCDLVTSNHFLLSLHTELWVIRLWDFFIFTMWLLNLKKKENLFNRRNCFVPCCGNCFIETIIISFEGFWSFLSLLSQVTLHQLDTVLVLPVRDEPQRRDLVGSHETICCVSDLKTNRHANIRPHFKHFTAAIFHENSVNDLPLVFPTVCPVPCEFTARGFLCLSGHLSPPLQTVREGGESPSDFFF